MLKTIPGKLGSGLVIEPSAIKTTIKIINPRMPLTNRDI